MLYYSGLLWLYRVYLVDLRGRSGSLILMYHRVLDDINAAEVHTQPGMAVSTQVFDRQMSHLKKAFSVCQLVDLASHVENHGKLPASVAVVTFDDGWRDNYTNAFPVLCRHDLPATVFVTTDYAGTNRPFWFLMLKWLLTESDLDGERLGHIISEACRVKSSTAGPSERLLSLIKNPAANSDGILEELKSLKPDILDAIIDEIRRESNLTMEYWEEAKPIMAWDEVREMAGGGIEIGSHGCSHRILTHLPDEEVRQELMNSKTKLDQVLGRPVTSFSYPNGDYDKYVMATVAQAGYGCAVTTGGKPEAMDKPDRFALRRLAIHQGISVGPSGKFSRAMFALHLTRHL